MRRITPARVLLYVDELQDVFDRIMTLSTGSIALLATFAEKFSNGDLWLGSISLIAFGLTILSCLSVRTAVPSFKLLKAPEPTKPELPVSPEVLAKAREHPVAAQHAESLLALEDELAQLAATREFARVGKLALWLAGSMIFALLSFVTALGTLVAFAITSLA